MKTVAAHALAQAVVQHSAEIQLADPLAAKDIDGRVAFWRGVQDC